MVVYSDIVFGGIQRLQAVTVGAVFILSNQPELVTITIVALQVCMLCANYHVAATKISNSREAFSTKMLHYVIVLFQDFVPTSYHRAIVPFPFSICIPLCTLPIKFTNIYDYAFHLIRFLKKVVNIFVSRFHYIDF